MWIAYLISRYDTHLVVENGIGWAAIGSTPSEAIQNLGKAWREGHDYEADVNLMWDAIVDGDGDDVLHTMEVKVCG